jgi:hypothetical protein
MDIIIPLFILALISAVFVRGIVRYVADNPWKLHRCMNHQFYFEEQDSRGIYCGVCHKDIDIEYYSKEISGEE